MMQIHQDGDSLTSLDPLYCLGMLALQTGRADEAAEWFHRVSLTAERSGAEGREELLRSARHHELLSREQAAAAG